MVIDDVRERDTSDEGLVGVIMILAEGLEWIPTCCCIAFLSSVVGVKEEKEDVKAGEKCVSGVTGVMGDTAGESVVPYLGCSVFALPAETRPCVGLVSECCCTVWSAKLVMPLQLLVLDPDEDDADANVVERLGRVSSSRVLLTW